MKLYLVTLLLALAGCAASPTIPSVGNNNGTLTWAASTMSAESVSNQPAYRTLYYIQLERVDSGAALLFFTALI